MEHVKLRIGFFGSSLVSSYWNGAATYYRGLLRALHGCGHTITFYESDAYDRQNHRDISDPDYARVVVYSSTQERFAREALNAAAQSSDVLIKASGNGVFDELLEQGILECRSKRPELKIGFWDVDAPATLDRICANDTDPFLGLIPEFDFIFTYGGGPPVIEGYRRFGARTCVPIYNGLDPMEHFPAAPDLRFSADLAFLGNRLPDREQRVEEFFFKTAQALPHNRFLLGGNGWHDRAGRAGNVQYLGHVGTEHHNVFNSTPRVVLNINRESMARYGYSPPTRIFEAAGAGACLIVDSWTGLEHFLEPGTECLTASSGEEVAQILSTIDESEARRIGAAALCRVRRDHTYAQRAAVVESALFPLFDVKGGRE